MKNQQYIYKILDEYKKKINSRTQIRISLPEGVSETNSNFYIITKDCTKPVRLKYGQTYWILNGGHDFSIKGNEFVTNSDLFNHDRELLIVTGDTIEPKCNHCQNPLIMSDGGQNFCSNCGELLDYAIVFKYVNVRKNYE